MSTPEYKPSEWRPDRLRIACHARGIQGPAQLCAEINRHRFTRNPNAARAMAKSTCSRWLSGDSNPCAGRTGFDIAVFEIADALDLSLDWLMGRVDVEPTIATRDMVNALAAEMKREVGS